MCIRDRPFTFFIISKQLGLSVQFISSLYFYQYEAVQKYLYNRKFKSIESEPMISVFQINPKLLTRKSFLIPSSKSEIDSKEMSHECMEYKKYVVYEEVRERMNVAHTAIFCINR